MGKREHCTATSKRTGKRCGRFPAPGATVCKWHGGAAKQVKAKAAKRQVEAQAQRMVALAGVDQDPIEHLIECLQRAKALENVWGEMVAAIDEKAEEESKADGFLRGELGYEETESDKGFTDMMVRPKDRLMAVDSRGESKVHPYMDEYQRAIERRAKFAKMCLDAGVAEKQVELYEQQIEIAHGAFEAGLAALDLDEDQKQAARKAYADRLRTS